MKDKILKAIDDEPEFPGEMPQRMENAIDVMFETKDKELFMYAVRAAVKLTKPWLLLLLAVTFSMVGAMH